MRKAIIYSFCLLALVACVPVVKYNKAQNELHNSQISNRALSIKLDSVLRVSRDLNADLNSIGYELEETQRYSSFSNHDLIKELDRERAERKLLAEFVSQLKDKNERAIWIADRRAESFAIDTKCALSSYSNDHFLLLERNIVLLDFEGLLESSKDRQIELKASLVELMKPLKNRDDWNIKVCLYQGSLNSEWNKITLQNEALGFFVSQASLPVSRVQTLTKITPTIGSTEFGFSTNSRVFIELEFNG